MLRWKLTGKVYWNIVDNPMSNIYQVSICPDEEDGWMSPEHTLTVIDGIIYQSYWNRYTIRGKHLSDLGDLFNRIKESEVYELLTDVKCEDTSNLVCIF